MRRLSPSRLRSCVLPWAVVFMLLNCALPWAGPAEPAQPRGASRSETVASGLWQVPAAEESSQEISDVDFPFPADAKRSQTWPPRTDKEAAGVASLPRKQRQELLKSNFAKLKREAAEITALAQSLQAELEESNENVLSMTILEKAQKIEALAKRISKTAKIY